MKQTLYKTTIVVALSLIGISDAVSCMPNPAMTPAQRNACMETNDRAMQQGAIQSQLYGQTLELQRQTQLMQQQNQLLEQQQQQQQQYQYQQRQQQQQQQRPKTCVRLADGSPMCFD
jgi:septal ring factor EnvC (AmiA/AmiB activator)